MQESKRSALTINASMEDETKHEIRDETEDEVTMKRKTKRKEKSAASSCRTAQRELGLWLSGVDESRSGEALRLSNAGQRGLGWPSEAHMNHTIVCAKSRVILAHSDGTGSPRLGAERTLSLERFPAIVKLCPPFV